MQRHLVKDTTVLCQETTFTTTRLSSLATQHTIIPNTCTAHHSKLVVQTLGFLSDITFKICINMLSQSTATFSQHENTTVAWQLSHILKEANKRDLIGNLGRSHMPWTKIRRE